MLDSQVSFSHNTEYVFRKCSRHRYLLRKLCQPAGFRICVQTSCRERFNFSVSFSVAWYGHFKCRNENRLCKIVLVVNKIVGNDQKPLTQLHTERRRKRGVSWQIAPIFSLASVSLWHPGGAIENPLATKNGFNRSCVSCAMSIILSFNPQIWQELFKPVCFYEVPFNLFVAF